MAHSFLRRFGEEAEYVAWQTIDECVSKNNRYSYELMMKVYDAIRAHKRGSAEAKRIGQLPNSTGL